ncbi:MAG: BlaI/MecI/CopY family transcriptional regulator [Planctomycetota bacterium]
MSEKILGLGSLQSEVMDLIWARDEATVAQLVELIGQRRSVSYTTVLSAVQKLEKKGWLEHRTEGRAYVYRAARKKTDVGGSKLRELLKTAFSGDPRLLLSSLMDEASLSDAELTELRKLIDERRKEQSKRSNESSKRKARRDG